MSGIGKLTSRLLPPMVIAAGSLLSLVVPAHAYDVNNCNRLLATFAVQQFAIEGGGADFGDEAHLAGVPLGTAVVCWSPGD